MTTEDDELRQQRELLAELETHSRRNYDGHLMCCAIMSRDGVDPDARPIYCNNPAVPGRTRCEVHLLVQGHMGALRKIARQGDTKSDQIKRARVRTQERLAALVDPAIAVLAREMVDPENKSSDRQAAANSLLDRAGWGRVQKVEHTDARDMLMQRLLEMRGESPSNVYQSGDEIHGIEVPGPGPMLNEDGELEDEEEVYLVESGVETLVNGIAASAGSPEGIVASVVANIEADVRARNRATVGLTIIEGSTED